MKEGLAAMKINNIDVTHNKIFAQIALGTGLILLVPLIAVQLSSQVNWSLGDFIVMGILLFGASSTFVLIARRIPKHRTILAIAALAIFLYIWAELAVGIFTTWGN